MSILQALILGLVQGLTEFIPISSSGHLVLLHQAMGISNGGLAFDVALHMGTLMALLLFFHKDIVSLARSLFVKSKHTRLAWLLALATIPAVIAGVLLESAAATAFRSVKLVGINLIVVALVMIWAERHFQKRAKHTALDSINKKQALAAGFAQAAAIIPGVSRSGATITAGLFVGLDRVVATRFSFLLAIPITLGAVVKVIFTESGISEIQSEFTLFSVGIASALVSGLFAIKFLLSYLSKHSLSAFAYYRIILGLTVLILLTIN